MVAAGDSDGKLVIRKVTTGAKLQTLDGHTAMIRSIIAPRGSGDVLVSADIIGTIIAWTYDSQWKLSWKLSWKVSEAHRFSVSAMSVKNNLLLTGGADGMVRIWGLGAGSLLREIEDTYDAVYDVAFQDVVGKEVVAVASRNGRTVLDVS